MWSWPGTRQEKRGGLKQQVHLSPMLVIQVFDDCITNMQAHYRYFFSPNNDLNPPLSLSSTIASSKRENMFLATCERLRFLRHLLMSICLSRTLPIKLPSVYSTQQRRHQRALFASFHNGKIYSESYSLPSQAPMSRNPPVSDSCPCPVTTFSTVSEAVHQPFEEFYLFSRSACYLR